MTKPLTIVELEQPRCALRFGVGDCTATGTKCYNTAGTCGDLENYDPSGSIKWRFADNRPVKYDYADFTDADNPELNPIPCDISVSTSEGQINAGAILEGRDPLGVTSKVTFTTSDFPWNDMWGDFYVADRTGYVADKPLPKRGPFWALWTARNLMFNDMYLRVYDGYEGQTLAEMRQRLHVLDKVNGPDGSGKVTITGLDPLRLAGDKKAEFPRTSKLDLFGDIDDATLVVRLFGLEVDLTDAFGNTGSTKYFSIGEELFSYTGFTDEGDGVYLMSGIDRGALGTVQSSHSDKDKVQRAGRYESAKFYRVIENLFKNHTQIPDEFIPISDWETEGDTYLPTYRTTRTVVSPTPVKELVGQIVQQGLFYIWWAEYEQEIKMLAVRPPDNAPTVLTDASHLLRGSVLTRDPSVRLTQVAVYFDQIDAFGGDQDETNYHNKYVTVDGENLGETRALSIFAPWISNRTQAVQLSIRLLLRYRTVPKFLTITVDAKDREITMGDVTDVETRTIVDSEGNVNRERWQVISAKEMKRGHSYVLNLQTFEFLGRFGRYMADASPDYDDATEAEREVGAWRAADDGLLPDNSEGYQYQ